MASSKTEPSSHHERSQLIIGAAVSWAMAVRRGGTISYIRQWEDLLLKAVDDWQTQGMEELLNDPVVRARREAYEKKQREQAELEARALESSMNEPVVRAARKIGGDAPRKKSKTRSKGKKHGRLR